MATEPKTDPDYTELLEEDILPAPRIRKIEMTPAEPVDLLAVAGAPLLKRVAPIILGVVGVLVLVRLRRRG